MKPVVARLVFVLTGGAAIAAGGALGYSIATRPALLHEHTAAPGGRPEPDHTRGESAGKRALLVGVTKYDHLPASRHLDGPANDVILFRELLTGRFGFAPEDIVCLTEAGGRDDLRPTRVNIEREFRRLAKAARPGDQVVVLLAGHGSRQPEADPPNPVHPEPDGIDETFLPADVSEWKGFPERVPNAITDDEIGAWLKAITARRAYVWAVFDCCHSGHMTRGASSPGGEVVREIEPGVLVPAEELAAARARAAARSGAAGAPARRPGGFVRPQPDEYLIALYACRSNETTPESRQPTGDPAAKYHGLLTYSLCEVLTRAETPLTYAELVRRVQARYAGRVQGSPTPAVEGVGRDREVLAVRAWPGRADVLLTRDADGYVVSAGELHGLTPGSVLAVEGPAGTAAAGERIGHVRVSAVGPAIARVDPCEYASTPAPASIPDFCPCRVVFTDYGAGRVKLAAELFPGPASDRVLGVMADLSDAETGVLEIVPDPWQAEWVVREVGGRLLLADGRGSRPEVPLPDPSGVRFRERLTDAVERLYRARNLLAVAARGDADAERSDVRFEVTVLRHDRPDQPGREVPPGVAAELREGEAVSLRVTNQSPFPIDVSLLIVAPDCEIAAFYPTRDDVEKQSIPPGGVLHTRPGPVAPPFGPEHLVAIGVRARVPTADFTCLAQRGLGAARAADTSNVLDTPLGRLLESALTRTGGTRGLDQAAVREVGTRVIHWRTKPAVVPPASSW
jgi:hypothetical protein